MTLLFQTCSVIFTLGNLVASQSQSPGWKEAINTTIINFNNEKMQITWAARKLFPTENVSFSYTFDEGKHKVWKQCTTYLLDQDYNAGCLFKTEGPTLAISIRNSNGSEEIFSKIFKSDFYIKPNRPKNVTFFWKEDAVTVSCNKPGRAVHCLRLELQYKSKFDKDWQSRISKCCSVGEQGFDPRKCYSFRVRLKRLAPQCNVVNYSSDWEAETFWMNGTLLGYGNQNQICSSKDCTPSQHICILSAKPPTRLYRSYETLRCPVHPDLCSLKCKGLLVHPKNICIDQTGIKSCSTDSCDDDRKPQSNTIIVLIFLLVVLLMMLILLILLCKWQRLRKSFMPAIPDPKCIFADLFSDHNGNFQEWINKTDHAMVQTKLENEDPECIIEAESQHEDEKNSDKQGSQEKIFLFSRSDENTDPKAAQIACLMPTSNTIASFAGFQILMNDDMYVMF